MPASSPRPDPRGLPAVAVGFKVVLVTGDNHVAAPQNISAAVNYDCVNCLTYALATQLFITLNGPLSDAATAKLNELWQQIADFGANIADVPLSQIRSRLTEFEQQIVQVVERDQGPLTPSASPVASSTAPVPAAGGPSGTAASGDGSASAPVRVTSTGAGASEGASSLESSESSSRSRSVRESQRSGTRPGGSTQPSSTAHPTTTPRTAPNP